MKTCKTGCGKMKEGGKVTAIKKMAKGGSMMGIVGMPQYSNNPRTDAGRTLKKGGTVAVTNRAVSAGCRGGMIKDASGKCVNERKFKSGGTVNKKFAALAPPYNKATFADKIAGAKKKVAKKKK